LSRSRISRPRFSVMISTLNRGEMLKRALRSVRRQNFTDYELIVVDDGSTEDIEAVVRETAPDALFRRLPVNLGIPGARNAALEMATGEIGAFLDSDDVWHPNFLSYHHNAYLQIEHPIFVFTDYYSKGPVLSGPVKQLVEEPAAPNALLHMMMRPFIHTMSCFTAPMDKMKSLGGFSTELSRFSDLDLYVRLLAGGKEVKTLSCLRHPAVGLPHIAVLKEVHIKDRSLDDYMRNWHRNKIGFLDRVFSYPCMARFQDFRAICEAKLEEGQESFFRNFAGAL
jgi:glycosyltransferase involved in cell wall biosynthesis